MIQTVIEYSEAGAYTEMSVRYPGPSLDVTRRGDTLSRDVLKSAAPEADYTYDPNAEYPNHLLLRWQSVPER